MIRFLSRFHPRYLKSLVYMFQASEYKITDYLSWYRRVKDFRHVAKKKKLVYTPKAILILAGLWLLLVGFVLALYFQFDVLRPVSAYGWLSVGMLLALEVLIFPNVIGITIIMPIVLGDLFIRAPVTFFMSLQARKILSQHKGMKIGITGSFGKTSMKEILRTVLSTGKNVAATSGNINTILGISRFAKKLKGNEDILIFEMAENPAGYLRRVCKLVGPDMGIITGVNEAHFKEFASLQSAANSVFYLADYLGKRPVYVNGESKVAKKNAKANHILYDRKGAGKWMIDKLSSNLSGTRFRAKKADTVIKVSSKLVGLHQAGPLIVSVNIAAKLGLTPKQIEKGIANTKPFAHRFEVQKRQGGVTVIDDTYNANPDGVRYALEFISQLAAKRKIYVTPGLVEMGSKSENIHRQIGNLLADTVDIVVLIKNSVTGHIEKGLRDAKYDGEVWWYENAKECYQNLDSLTRGGDLVLMQNDWPDNYA